MGSPLTPEQIAIVREMHRDYEMNAAASDEAAAWFRSNPDAVFGEQPISTHMQRADLFRAKAAALTALLARVETLEMELVAATLSEQSHRETSMRWQRRAENAEAALPGGPTA